MYLDNKDSADGAEVMVRRRTQHKQSTYTYCTRMPAEGGKRSVLERHISGREHEAQKRGRDPARLDVLKQTACFVYEQIYYELNTYVEPEHGARPPFQPRILRASNAANMGGKVKRKMHFELLAINRCRRPRLNSARHLHPGVRDGRQV